MTTHQSALDLHAWATDPKATGLYAATKELAAEVSAAYLALTRADDGEAIDEAWLRSVGFVYADFGLRLNSAESSGHLRHTNIFRHNNGEWWANGLGCAPCKNRSDLRSLARALGISLKGEV